MDADREIRSDADQPKKKATKTAAAVKLAKTTKKPIKVVYISNPVKFTTSASEFRALVQDLTGRDSDLPFDMDNYVFSPPDVLEPEAKAETSTAASLSPELNNIATPVISCSSAIDCPHRQHQQPSSSSSSLELLQEGFSPLVLEDFNDFMSSSFLYDLQELASPSDQN